MRGSRAGRLLVLAVVAAGLPLLCLALLGTERVFWLAVSIVNLSIGAAAIRYADRFARLRTWSSSGWGFETNRRLSVIGGIFFIAYGIISLVWVFG
jgi:hypothetical protein